jgi:hypothetical protein
MRRFWIGVVSRDDGLRTDGYVSLKFDIFCAFCVMIEIKGMTDTITLWILIEVKLKRLAID